VFNALQDVCAQVDSSGVASVVIDTPVLISGLAGEIAAPCVLQLAGAGSLSLVNVQLRTKSLVIEEEAHATGAKVLIDHSQLSGAAGSGLMISMNDEKASIAVVGGSTLDYPLSVAIGTGAAGGQVRVADSAVTSDGATTNGIVIVAAEASFERVQLRSSDKQGPVVVAKSCSYVDPKGAKTDCGK